MSSRIVVTGIGIVSSIGVGHAAFWKSLTAGRSGISTVSSFDTSQYSVNVGGEVKSFEPDAHIQRLESSEIGRASQFAIAAARMALLDADVDPDTLEPGSAGVSMGTTSGEPNQIEDFDDHYIAEDFNGISEDFISTYPCHAISGHVASELKFSGSNIMIPAACAAGTYAIAHAFDELRGGRTRFMLAGGADSFSRITYSGFARLLAIAQEKCQPFDKNRKGMIPGEGAAILCLEPLESATARDAKIYAEVAGYGLSCDAYHMTGAHPDGTGAARAMEQALSQSELTPGDIDYISAHGTGTKSNDLHETTAVKQVFGGEAYTTPISSIKSMLGHTMGAASAIESAVCALAITNGCIPPTINFEEPDPECDLDYVPNVARDGRIDVAMNNAYAFGGTNASLIMKKCEV